jgi:hypothetical protein
MQRVVPGVRETANRLKLDRQQGRSDTTPME